MFYKIIKYNINSLTNSYFLFLVDKQINVTGSIRRVCSLVDLSQSITNKDSQLHNGSKYFFSISIL